MPVHRWVLYGTDLITVLAVFLTLLMLLTQKDIWVTLVILVGVCIVNTVTTIYELDQRRNAI
jgi:hypothetical protein